MGGAAGGRARAVRLRARRARAGGTPGVPARLARGASRGRPHAVPPPPPPCPAPSLCAAFPLCRGLSAGPVRCCSGCTIPPHPHPGAVSMKRLGTFFAQRNPPPPGAPSADYERSRPPLCSQVRRAWAAVRALRPRALAAAHPRGAAAAAPGDRAAARQRLGPAGPAPRPPALRIPRRAFPAARRGTAGRRSCVGK